MALYVLLAASQAAATTYDSMSLADLQASADVVVLARIEKAELLLVDRASCGAKYRARVLEPVKGPFKVDDAFEFGRYGGKGVGETFLLFLTAGGNEFWNPSSTIGAIIASREEDEKKCAEQLPDLREMREGLGSLEVSWTIHYPDDQQAVLFNEEWLDPPPGLRRKKWRPFDNQMESERSWVRASDVVEYLRALDPNGRAKTFPPHNKRMQTDEPWTSP